VHDVNETMCLFTKVIKCTLSLNNIQNIYLADTSYNIIHWQLSAKNCW